MKLYWAKSSDLPKSSAFLYGHSFFDKMRVYQGQVILLKQHAERFVKSMSLCFGQEISLKEAVDILNSTISKCNGSNGILRISVFVHWSGSPFEGKIEKHFIDFQFQSSKEDLFENIPLNGFTLGPNAIPARSHASLKYGDWSWFLKQGEFMEEEKALFFKDDKGFIRDGAYYNIAGVQNEKVFLFDSGRYGVDGCLKRFLQEEMKWPTIEVHEQDLGNFDDLWILNSVRGIQSVLREPSVLLNSVREELRKNLLG